MKKIKLFPLAALLAASALTFTVTSCGEETPDDDNTSGGYTTSDEVASANLVAKFSFENNVDDAKGNITGGTASGTSFVAGAKGQAWKGASNGYVLYTGVSSAISGLKSLTVASWIKTTNHMDGAESWFQLLNDSNWIGNLFVLQESGATGNDSTRIKFTMNNWNATAWKEQWTELANENRIKIG
ncbi:MAG: hypothetical protein ACK45C_04255, partial [Bacteroidota bacterium]